MDSHSILDSFNDFSIPGTFTTIHRRGERDYIHPNVYIRGDFLIVDTIPYVPKSVEVLFCEVSDFVTKSYLDEVAGLSFINSVHDVVSWPISGFVNLNNVGSRAYVSYQNFSKVIFNFSIPVSFVAANDISVNGLLFSEGSAIEIDQIVDSIGNAILENIGNGIISIHELQAGESFFVESYGTLLCAKGPKESLITATGPNFYDPIFQHQLDNKHDIELKELNSVLFSLRVDDVVYSESLQDYFLTLIKEILNKETK